MTRDERLRRVLAYMDGELSPHERAAFEAEAAADPTLLQEVAAHRALAARLAEAYAPVVDEPVPIELTLAASAANDRRASRAPLWAAVAASLVLGVFAGRLTLPDRAVWVPSGRVAQALNTALAADAGPVRVGLTFRDHEGRWCRTFQSPPDRLAGLACREKDVWRLEVAAPLDAPSSAYRQAGSATPAPVLAAVDAIRAGETLDAAAEKAARDAGWDSSPGTTP